MRYLRTWLCLALLYPMRLMADAQPADWVGEFTMNHDGHIGTLSIVDKKIGCRIPRWCNLGLSYKDANGAAVPGRVATLDVTGQHMLFFLDFPGNTQRFDAYLFSGDNTKMAGTTIWQGRVFGMFATRQAAVPVGSSIAARLVGPSERVNRAPLVRPAGSTLPGRCTLTGTPTAVVAANGAIELHYPDGAVRHGIKCGGGTTCPDGHFMPDSCVAMEAIPPTPPPLPGDDTTKKWLEWHNQALMQILSGLLGNDQGSLNNYKTNYETGNVSLYQKISAKTEVISGLSIH